MAKENILSNRRKRFIKEFHKQDGKCYWCKSELVMRWDIPGHISPKIVPHIASREHIIPESDGGCSNWPNIKIVCHECNDLRSKIPHDAFKWVTSNSERYAKFIEYKAHKENSMFETVKKKKEVGRIKGIMMCAIMFYMMNLYAHKFTYRSFS